MAKLEPLLTVTEVASWLRVTNETVYQMVKREEFKPGVVVRIGPLVRFKRRKLLRSIQ